MTLAGAGCRTACRIRAKLVASQPQLARADFRTGMIKAQTQTIAGGAMLFDAAQMEHADESWFAPDRARAGASTGKAGRGEVVYFEAPFGACVLRHYHRGGLVAHVNADRYLWTGRRRTRSFREFRLLMELHEAGLPVPAPLMARYRRHGITYRADLVTRQIPGARTLAERLATGELDAAMAARVGRTLAGFHARGVWHADLNAHNLLVDPAGKVWLIDFDRCRIRKPAMPWQQANLGRLLRSFRKLHASRTISDFDDVFWHPMLAAYHRSLADSYARGERP